MEIHSLKFRSLFVIFLFLNLLGAQILHEAGHLAVLQLYGRKPLWAISSMVQIWDREPRAPEEWARFTDPEGDQGWLYMASAPESDTEMLLFILAGPLAQVFAVLLGVVVVLRSRTASGRTWGLLFLLVNAFSQFFYQLISLLRGSAGDEKLIGHYLDISPAVLHLLFGGFHLIFLVAAFWWLGSGRTRWTWGLAVFLGTLPVGPVIMQFNRWIIEQVDAGQPWAIGVLGFTLPVFLTGVTALLVLWKLQPQVRGAPILTLNTLPGKAGE